MAMFRVEAGGKTYRVDAPSPEAAAGAVEEMMKAVPAAAPAKTAEGPNMLEAGARGAADMLTFGLSDEIGAGVRTGFGLWGDYDKDVEAVRRNNAAAQAAHPWAYMGGQVAGAIPTMFIPGVNAVRGASLGAKVAKGALVGSGMGAAYGYGSGEGGVINRAAEAVKGGIIGGVTGGAIPAIGAGIGRAVAPVKKRANQLLARALTDDALTPAQARARLAELGPDAMLADLGPNLQRQAGALAATPGRAQDVVRSALRSRSAGANTRIRADLDATLGQAPIPSRVDAAIVANQRALAPEYQRALAGARAVDTSRIAAGLDSQVVNLRGPAQVAAARVRRMLNVVGDNVLDPNPATLLQTRQAIDGMLETEANSQVIRVLSAARQQVDDALAAAVPGIKRVDAKFAELARQREALTRGQSVLEGGRTAPRPDELADEVATGALPQGLAVGPSAVPLRLREGARAEIERIVGTNSNDVVALRRLIKGEGSWNRDRLATLFGADRADRILQVLEREAAFADTANVVTRNSETAARAAAQAEVAPGTSGLAGGGAGLRQFDITKPADAAARVFQFLTGGMSADRTNARNADLAAALMMSGGPRETDPVIDRLVRALLTQERGAAAERAATYALMPPARVTTALGLDALDGRPVAP